MTEVKTKLPQPCPALITPQNETRLQLWMEKLENDPPPTDIGIPPAEDLPSGSEAPWIQWKTLNRLRTRTGWSKAALVRWGYKTGPTTCECGESGHTIEHCLVCPQLPNPCSSQDIAEFNKNAKKCVKKWETGGLSLHYIYMYGFDRSIIKHGLLRRECMAYSNFYPIRFLWWRSRIGSDCPDTSFSVCAAHCNQNWEDPHSSPW